MTLDELIKEGYVQGHTMLGDRHRLAVCVSKGGTFYDYNSLIRQMMGHSLDVVTVTVILEEIANMQGTLYWSVAGRYEKEYKITVNGAGRPINKSAYDSKTIRVFGGTLKVNLAYNAYKIEKGIKLK